MGGHAEVRRLREVRSQICRWARNGRTGKVFCRRWADRRAWRRITRIAELLLLLVIIIFHISIIWTRDEQSLITSCESATLELSAVGIEQDFSLSFSFRITITLDNI
jgi:hypothetical protein